MLEHRILAGNGGDFHNTDLSADGMVFRPCRPEDGEAVQWLYDHGFLSGHDDPDEGDRPLTIWVAETEGEVVGTVGLVVDEAQVAHVRALRVAPIWRERHLSRRLIQFAVEQAREQDCLKLMLHTFADADRAANVVRSLGFNLAGLRDEAGRKRLEFYLDLYKPPTAPQWGEIA